jgi:hypothetical protein
MHFEFIKRPQDVPALESSARRLWEEVTDVSLTERQGAELFNASSIVARVARMDPTAPTQNMDGSPGANWPLNIVSAINTIEDKVNEIKGLITAPAPVEVDYAALAAALRPIVADEVVKALNRTALSVEPAP